MFTQIWDNPKKAGHPQGGSNCPGGGSQCRAAALGWMV